MSHGFPSHSSAPSQPRLRPPTASSLPTSSSPSPSSSLPPRPHHPMQLHSTRPRPAPARQGAPASMRDFARSSAGGASSHLGYGDGASHSPGLGVGATPPGQGQGHAQGLPAGPRGLGRGSSRPPLLGGQARSASEGDMAAASAATTAEGGAERGRGGARSVMSEAQRNKSEAWGESYVASEETIRNDYSSRYVETGQRPQNHLRNTAVETRFAEYPKLALLLQHKHALLSSPSHSIPPTYFNLSSLPPLPASTSPLPLAPPSDMQRALSTLSSPSGSAAATGAAARFDAILLTPPPGTSFDELAALDLGRAAATPGFVWLWVGSGQTGAGAGAGTGGGGIGLEKGRELLNLWGYRRCEDIVWLKTNRRAPEGDLAREPSPLFTSTLEHCLMGIRGTVRRSTDSNLVHCNVDTDVVVWEGDEGDPALKPPELQSLIENFCLGTRRLHLYGSPHALRRGWLTVSAPSSPSSSSSSADAGGEGMYGPESVVHPVEKEGSAEEQEERWGRPREWARGEWEKRWRRAGGVPVSFASTGGPGPGAEVGAGEGGEEVGRVESLLPFVEELDALRPKSPPQRNGVPSSGGLGRGRGAGLGITRSGLIPPSHSGSPAPGAGRGRGRGGGGGGGGMVQPPPPPPMGLPYPVPVAPGSNPSFLHPNQHQPYPNQHFAGQQNSFYPPPPPPPSAPPYQRYPPQQQHYHSHQQQQHSPYAPSPSPYNSYAPTPSPFANAPSPYPPSHPPSAPPLHFPPAHSPSPYMNHNPYAPAGAGSNGTSPSFTPAGLPFPLSGQNQHFPGGGNSFGGPGQHVQQGHLAPDQLAALMAQQMQLHPHSHALAANSVAASPVLAPHALPRMASTASLAPSLASSVSEAGGAGAGGEGIVYPISSTRASGASLPGVAGGGGWQ